MLLQSEFPSLELRPEGSWTLVWNPLYMKVMKSEETHTNSENPKLSRWAKCHPVC